MRHPDLSVLQAETEGGTLKVDQVREVRRALALKPYQSSYRVALFLRFQEASEGAANALLKTLEEAPGYAVLILTADAPEQCCQRSPRAVKCYGCARFPKRSKPFVPGRTARADLIASRGRLVALQLLKDELPGLRAERLADLGQLLASTRVQSSLTRKMAKDKENMRQTAGMVILLAR
jgi:hypothetical protein